MLWSSKHALLGALAFLLFLPDASATSDLAAGNFVEKVPSQIDYQDLGSCRFYTGPRDPDLQTGHFMMSVGDQHAPNLETLRITGTVKTSKDSAGIPHFEAAPDRAATEVFFEGVLRQQLDDPTLELRIHSLTAEVRLPADAEAFTCRVNLRGRVQGSAIGMLPVTLSFDGPGDFIPGETAQTADSSPRKTNAPLAAGPNCPLDQLAPAGLVTPCDRDRPGCKCPEGSQCLVDFKKYKWWTNFAFRGPPFKNPSWYWNNYNIWSSQNVSVDGEGLHLFIRKQDVGQKPDEQNKPAAAEVALMFNSDSDMSPANLGYGDYLVTAKIKTAATWSQLDPNVTFGAFTFERFGTEGDATGDTNNPFRELDPAEISRWGFNGSNDCKTVDNSRLCTGNAQFTVQNWEAPKNIKRYNIVSTGDTVPLVMRWHAAHQPVTFEQYDGSFSLATLPGSPSFSWKTDDDQNPYIPATNCERFHLNLWNGGIGYVPAKPAPQYAPPPSALPYEVVVTNFEFKPLP